jgi:hypothetical protein
MFILPHIAKLIGTQPRRANGKFRYELVMVTVNSVISVESYPTNSSKFTIEDFEKATADYLELAQATLGKVTKKEKG